MKKTSKFKSRQDEHTQNVNKRRATISAENEVDGIVQSSEDFTTLEGYDPINDGDLVFNSIHVTCSN